MDTLITKNDVMSRAKARWRFASLVMTVSIGVVVSFFVFYIERGEEQSRIQAELETQAETYVAAIQKGIERNLEVLESVACLYAASDEVERDDFRRFVQGPLSRHREIQALSWNERVTHSERSQFEDSVRLEGYPEFQFKDWLLDGQRVVPIERPEYIVVTYIEPYESNQAVLGFDVASNPTRLAALESARDTGEMIATGRITLVQETGDQYGFLILKPIYKTPAVPETVEGRRQNLEGFAVGVFRVGDMVESALEDLPEGIFNIQLVDEASPADESLLYPGQASDSDNPPDVVNPEEVGEEQLKARGELYLREPLEIPGRQWSLLISPRQRFYATHGSREPWVVLGGGLLMTALLSVYLISMIRGANKIQAVAGQLSMANIDLAGEIIQNEQREEALRESEERYRSLYQNTPVMMHSIDLDGRLVSVNDHWLMVLGYERSEVIGRQSVEFLTDASRHYATNVAIPEFFKAGGVAKEVEYQFVMKNGEVRDTLLSGVGERNESGEICRLSGFIIDVTERKQAEQALQESEERYRRLVELSPDAIVVVSEGKIVFANSAEATLMAASSPEELIGKSAINILHPEDRTTVGERLRRIDEAGEAPHVNEGKIIRLDGQVRDIEAAGAPIIYQGKKAVQIIARDTTDRKRAEEELKEYSARLEEMVEERTGQLRESQALLVRTGKMEAIGHLAAGVAHELNNPLGAVVGYADMVLERGNMDGLSRDYVTRILKRAEQAAKVVRQLKGFAQTSELQKVKVDLGQVIEDTIEMVTHQMSLKEIRIVTQFDAQSPPVWADPDRLEQVFLNLTLNARDAMPQGGELTVTMRPGGDGRPTEVAFADTGVGISKENLGKIFDPFFTFGKKGDGTGLGLSICQRIVQDHGGHIEVESKVGKGSTFTVVLPGSKGT